MHAHPLKVVEPELFAPEDLLQARPGLLLSDQAAADASAGPSSSHQQQQQAAGAHKWFANWFGSANGSEGGEPDGAESPLRQPPFVLRVPASVSEQEEVQVAVTRLLVECYFDIVRAALQDAVPKALMHFLVLHVQRGLQQHLIHLLYRCAHACRHAWAPLADCQCRAAASCRPCVPAQH